MHVVLWVARKTNGTPRFNFSEEPWIFSSLDAGRAFLKLEFNHAEHPLSFDGRTTYAGRRAHNVWQTKNGPIKSLIGLLVPILVKGELVLDNRDIINAVAVGLGAGKVV